MRIFTSINSSFTVVRSTDAPGLLHSLESGDKAYSVVADRWRPGDVGLLIGRSRFVQDLVQSASATDSTRLRAWNELLQRSPNLLSTFVASELLGSIVSLHSLSNIQVDLSPTVLGGVQNYITDLLAKPRLQATLRAEVVDVAQAKYVRNRGNAIAVANSEIVGVYDRWLKDEAPRRTRGSTPRDVAPGPGPVPTQVQPAHTQFTSKGQTAEAPQPPAAVSATAPQTAAGAPEIIPFLAHPRIGVGRAAERGKVLPFAVGFSDSPDPDAEEQKRIKLDASERGDTLLVIATAEGATIEEPAYAELPLDLAAEHDFTAHVDSNATRVVLRAQYLYRNKPVGHIIKSVPMEGGADVNPAVSITAGKRQLPALARDIGAEVAGVDILLVVEKGRPGYVSWIARISNTGKVHGPFEVALEDADAFAKHLAGLRKNYGDSGNAAMEELKVTGQRIAQCIPAEIKQALAPALTAPRAPAVLLVTDQPFIPWELARLGPPYLRQPAFIGEVARIGRWWTGTSLAAPPSLRSIQHISAVAATSYAPNLTVTTLTHAVQERDWLCANFKGHARPYEARQPDIDNWLDTDPRLPGHVGHIALHGFSDVSSDVQGLILADGKFLTPNRLAGQYYAGDTPRFDLVFLNACQVGTAGERLGRIAGFPGALLSGGASGFLGPLWEVDDAEAQRTAETFYDLVFPNKQEAGEALRQIRSSPNAKNSITPWAYLYYGHPCLQLSLS